MRAFFEYVKIGRITAPRTFEIFDSPEPACGAGEVKVKLEYGCLCGTDSPFFSFDFEGLKSEGRQLLKRMVDYEKCPVYPLPDGMPLHECVGRVVESHSARFWEGQLVLALPLKLNGFAEYLALPDALVFPLPITDVPAEELLLCQPLGTIHYAFRKIPDLTGKSVAVVGQGPIGQLMNAELVRRGARSIFAIDKLASRLQRSRLMGASDIIHSVETEAAQRLRDLNEGNLADVVIEAVGHQELAVESCVDLVKQDGQLLIFGGVDSDKVDSYPLGIALRKNLSIHHSIGAGKAEHFLPAAEMIAERRVELAPVITHRFPFTEAQQALEVFVDRREGALKVLLEF